MEWVSAAEGGRFAQLIKEFVEDVKKIGPSPLKHLNRKETAAKS